MKNFILSIFFICSIISGAAQSISSQTLNASGNSSVAGAISLEWSVGEMVAVQTFSSPNTMLTQGLLQPSVVFNAPLPITLLYFSGKEINKQHLLSWATSQEINNHHFDVERSSNGINFQLLKQVPGAGNSSVTKTYSLTDSLPYPTTWYRLKQVDADGKYSYSVIIRLQINNPIAFTMYPNPANNVLNLSVKEINKPLQVSIFDMSGKMVVQKNLNSGTAIPIDIHHLSGGAYVIHVRMLTTETIWSAQFIKQ